MNGLIVFIKGQMGDMTQGELARRVGMNTSYVSQILNENRPVTWAFAKGAAEVFGLDYIRSFELAGLIDKKEGQPDEPASPRRKSITA